MNERIEELAKECYVKTGSEHTDHFAYWKFAKLIVEECALIAGLMEHEGRKNIGAAILDRFEVKE